MFKLTTRQITISGLLIAVSVMLGILRWGFIPLPTPAGAATLMHLPVIIAGISLGPFIGAIVGLIFGVFAWQYFPAYDPIVHLVPRIFIGPAAYLFFTISLRILKKIPNRNSLIISAVIGSIAGTIVNTAGVLSIAVLRHYFPWPAAAAMALTHGIPEIIISVITIPPIILGIKAYQKDFPENQGI